MKSKELIQLIVALLVLAGAGILIFSLVGKGKSTANNNARSYEIVSPIPGSYNQSALNVLGDNNKAHDYYVKPDLHNGVGNPQPFTPLK